MKGIILIFIAANGFHTIHAKNTSPSLDLATESFQEVQPTDLSNEDVVVPVRRSERIKKNNAKQNVDIQEENLPSNVEQPLSMPLKEDTEVVPIKKNRGRPPKVKQDMPLDNLGTISIKQEPTSESFDFNTMGTPPHKARGRHKKIHAPHAFQDTAETAEVLTSLPSQEPFEETTIHPAEGAVESLVSTAQKEPSFTERLKHKAYSGLSQAGTSLKNHAHTGAGYIKNAAQDGLKALSANVRKRFSSSQETQPETLSTEIIKETSEPTKRGRGRPKKSKAPKPEMVESAVTVLEPSFTEALKQKTYSGLSQAGSSLKNNTYKGAYYLKDTTQDQLKKLGDTVKQKTYSRLSQAGSAIQDRANRFKDTAMNHLYSLGDTIKTQTAPYRQVPKTLKNLGSNLSYRYLNKTTDVIKDSYALFKTYTDMGKRAIQHVESDLGKVSNVVVDTATGAASKGWFGALTGMATSAAKGATSFGLESLNPVITVIQTVDSLKHLTVILETFFSFYRSVEYGGVNFISDTGRNITTFGKHALNFFKDPEEFKAIVDNYVFEKYFKWIIRLGILSFGAVNCVEWALPELAAIPDLTGKLSLLLKAVKTIPDTVNAYFGPVNQAKSWSERAVALKECIFNNNIRMKQIQQFALNAQSSLLTALNEFATMDAEAWEKDGYPGVASMVSGFKKITKSLSSAMGYETSRLDKEIWVNEKVADAQETVSNIKSTVSNAASAVSSAASNAASGALNTLKNWVY